MKNHIENQAFTILKILLMGTLLSIFSGLPAFSASNHYIDQDLDSGAKNNKYKTIIEKLSVLDSRESFQLKPFVSKREKAKKALRKSWKCEDNDLLNCLYSLGHNGIYDIKSEKFFSYFPKAEYELIEEHFDFLRISKSSTHVQLQFFLKDVESVKFSLLGKEYPRVTIAHKSKMIIVKSEISDLKVLKYPKWLTRLMPLSIRDSLVSIDDNIKNQIRELYIPDISRKVTLQKIYLHDIKFVKDQFEGLGTQLNEISVINVENEASHKKIYLLAGTSFFLPTMKALRKNEFLSKRAAASVVDDVE